jgi:hypothetical protein
LTPRLAGVGISGHVAPSPVVESSKIHHEVATITKKPENSVYRGRIFASFVAFGGHFGLAATQACPSGWAIHRLLYDNDCIVADIFGSAGCRPPRHPA